MSESGLVNLGSVKCARCQSSGCSPPCWERSGPVRSGFGWHVLRITGAQPEEPRSLAQAHNEARQAWIQADRRQRNADTYRQLLAHYSVTRADQR